MEFNGIIYCYTNKINGKKYIGQTIASNQVKRHYRHKYRDVKNETAFSRAVKKYGYDSFILENIAESIPDTKSLDEAEIFYIKELNTKVPHGYNITEGGKGLRGYKRSQDTIAKLSGTNNHNYGKPMKESAKQALREANARPEVKEAVRQRAIERNKKMVGELNPWYGTKMSDERKAILARAHTELLSGENNPSARAVVCIEPNKTFLTMKETIAFTNKSGCSNISSVCRGKLKRYAGYTWRYATEEEIELEKNRRCLNK